MKQKPENLNLISLQLKIRAENHVKVFIPYPEKEKQGHA